MSTKCKKCGAPITGFWAKIAALAGVKQSLKDPECCNKCDSEVTAPVSTPATPASPSLGGPAEQPKDLFEAEVKPARLDSTIESKREAPKVEEPKQE